MPFIVEEERAEEGNVVYEAVDYLALLLYGETAFVLKVVNVLF